MARPNKKVNYIVRRIADLFHYYDRLPWSKLKQGKEWKLRFPGTRPMLITSKRDIECAIGLVLGELEPKKRPYVLRQLIKVLEGKSDKKRKTKSDEIALVREAWRGAKRRRAKAKLLFLVAVRTVQARLPLWALPFLLKTGDNPTYREADTEFFKDNGYHLDRRALKDADCPVRPGKPGRPK